MTLFGQAAPRSYGDHKRQILARFSKAQREWEREAGARLVVSQVPPYFSYTADHSEGSRRSAAWAGQRAPSRGIRKGAA